MEQNYRDLIALAASAVNQTPLTREQIGAMDLDRVYEAAAYHQMTAVADCALELAGVENPAFRRSRITEIIKTESLDQERAAVARALTEAKIWFMPLKGIYMREYYPLRDMRQMVDNDILVDPSRREDVARIMSELGFQQENTGILYHDEFWKPPFCHFEMHWTLFNELSVPALYKYYANIREKLIGDGFELRFSDEDFYVFMIAHNYKHYLSAGIGLRALLDVYVYLQRFGDKLDWNYMHGEMKKMGFDAYERGQRSLARKVFSPGAEPLSAQEVQKLEVYLRSGTHGTREQLIGNAVEREGPLHYMKRRLIFDSMDQVKEFYPFFYRHRILLPFLPLYRLIHSWKNVRSEVGSVVQLIRRGKKKPKSPGE